MRVSIECPDVSITALRDRAHSIAIQLPPRTATRRAVVACWTALSTARSIKGARQALRTFGSERTQADAAAILDSLAEPQHCAVGWDSLLGYYCTHCGTTAQAVPQATEIPGD